MMKILYIEDDASSRHMFSAGIQNRIDNCEIEVAETAEVGLERLAAERFDLLITDLKLPGKSGLDVLRENKYERPEMEVIVLTSNGLKVR